MVPYGVPFGGYSSAFPGVFGGHPTLTPSPSRPSSNGLVAKGSSSASTNLAALPKHLADLWPASLGGPKASATTEKPTARRVMDLVGNTPLCDVTHLAGITNPRVKIYAKCEGDNPAGSVKDRPALSMILRAIERGELKAGGRLIEATSGNTGIALAMIAQAVGVEMHLAMPANSTAERTQTMQAYGATVHLVDGNMEDARDYADKLVAESKDSDNPFVMLNQFGSPDNPRIHYETTGPEIWQDTNGKVTHFVSAMGTTGTIMGVSKFLKEKNPNIQIVGCQPAPGSRIPGIRTWPKEYLPLFFEPDRVDETVEILQKDAEDTARRLAMEGGLLSGISAGGACWAALQIAKQIDEGVIVFIQCDRGDRYLSSGVFAPEDQRQDVDAGGD